ncbi:hypothetical protein Patl1_16747 [Pistacia atlantica]|uniref:Uncharacterized protein n=1 Tax=Pistacia atlantica TaxID=434234 RepID=A0ACC1B9E9_9ROSI|nr:hypothetical protein Patl1_16747 [Pistacia atlantica]
MKSKSRLTTAVICFGVLVLVLHVPLTSFVDRIWFSETITCDYSNVYDLCAINGPALLEPITTTFFSMDPTNLIMTPPSSFIKTRPYPRKTDKTAMSRVKELTLSSTLPDVWCGVTHDSPAVVFSTGGYTGNFFHEFMDGFIPLYITFNSIFLNHHQDDIILVITDYKDWWSRKYEELLAHFSRHPIINMDNENLTHCFPSVIVGLISHGPMIINPKLLPHPKTLLDFQAILQNAYSQDPDEIPSSQRPRLVLVNRNAKVGRMIMNLEEVIKTANDVGFDVTIFEPARNTSLVESFKLIHASHAMLGVHGAALTNFLFLRPGSVLMQVVPIGTQWLSDSYFRNPARVLGLEYLEYKIKAEESSLAERYGANDTVLTNPKAFTRGNWKHMHLYLKTQNVKFDKVKLKRYLKNAYRKAKIFMDKES